MSAPRLLTLALVAAGLSGCAADPIVAPLRYAPVAPAPEEPFRASAPAAAHPSPRAPVASRTLTLANGLRVVVLERHALPIVTVRLVVDRGSIDAGAARETFDILAWAMGRGSTLHGAGAFEDAWASLGARHGKLFDVDRCALWAKTPARELDPALNLLAEQALAPLLDVAEVNRARNGARAAFSGSREDTGQGMRRNMLRLLFGQGHPYAFSPPDAARARAVDPAAVLALHARLFQPAQATLIIAGDVTVDAARQSAERWLGAWTPQGPPLDRAAVPPPIVEGVRVAMIPHVAQAQIQGMVLASLPEVGATDLAAVEVLSRAIGGLTSPMQVLRSEHGAIYTLHEDVEETRGTGFVVLGGSFERSLAVGSLHAIVNVIAQVRDGGITQTLVDSARASLLAAWVARTSTTDGLTGLVASSVARGGSVEDALSYPDRLAAVTPADVQRVARRWLGVDSLRAFALGEPRWIDELWRLGLGPYQVRNEMAEAIPLRR